ncbi:small serum protein 5-like [Erythrolamprus reginae]|uniref:small serum protein 5-like n=1 Tax=Erythrolamprus reginae TaxID=121349 RepID=UPI00396CE0AF
MKIFLSLILFSLMLATCQGACMVIPNEAEFIDGKLVVPETCTDRYDGRKHLLGSTWNTAQCLRCSCSEHGYGCCHRHGGTRGVEGCNTVLNRATCEYEHYRLDNPTQRCRI